MTVASDAISGSETPNDGWSQSASAWIDGLGSHGDWSRAHVLDRPMLRRVALHPYRHAIDIGCGEGRFCRLLNETGIRTTGIDPTHALIDRARVLDPGGDYRVGRAEALEFGDASFDLAIFYLSLIDIPDLQSAIAEAHRILKPGGSLLIANLQSFNTAGDPAGWVRDAEGVERFYIDHYLDERSQWINWSGIRIRNWHRPLGVYMQTLLQSGFALCGFEEPEPDGGDPVRAARYRRAPGFLIMEWQKISTAGRATSANTAIS
ncbi:Ubiquinone/menaquinone biosynthesis C-methylase UbiE [Novosphingobium sp. CF614]|uniref:class I SAM-dependent methyltransferase n=1 Tax=Novosphingobium sp. CF614 TaxID=1884364 RepID=UPI0008EDF184|nr:class I SAM-dependent methyltransferase [Novosphingobium sp. CF614]SFG16859.1 Ubiquinone/menaquinone biosynthesis C-methylase UbiE [Novosphingobium sp. CF614]